MVVVIGHKPLTKILGDRTLDEIERLKQRTLPWSFKIYHMAGETNHASDDMSIYPSPSNPESHNDECAMTAAIHNESNKLMKISWEGLAKATGEDPAMSQLLNAIQEGFPDCKRVKDSGVSIYWTYRESLYILHGVIMYKDRIVVPPALRD